MSLLKKGGLTPKYYKNLWHSVLQLWFLLVFEINIEQWWYTMKYLSTMLSIGARNEDGAPVHHSATAGEVLCTMVPLLV